MISLLTTTTTHKGHMIVTVDVVLLFHELYSKLVSLVIILLEFCI